ncbi:MAG: hypothetical protein AAGA95_10550 [Pseudomonadota bacterium]
MRLTPNQSDDLRTRILTFIREAGSATRGDVITRLGISEDQAQKHLATLCAQRHIRRNGRGTYVEDKPYQPTVDPLSLALARHAGLAA